MSQKILSLSRVTALVTLTALVGCSSAPEEPRPGFTPGGRPGPTPEAAEQNSKPPVPGAPLEGVFVSTSRGAADGDGSMQRPFKTLGDGIRRAQTSGKRVIACAETYPEQLSLQSGVSVYGYFSCDGGVFVMSAEKRARVASPVSPALVAESVSLPTRLEGFDVVAPDGTDASPSSIAARIAGSRGLVIGKSSLRAGAGKDGADGVEPPPAAAAGVDGVAGVDVGDCSAAPFNCYRVGGVNPSPGGAGGRSVACGAGIVSHPGGEGGAGANQRGAKAAATGGAGGSPATAAGGAAGDLFGLPGAAGDEGAAGADGGPGAVQLEEGGPVLRSGAAGTHGAPGQGGGGGGGASRNGEANDYSASGGGGGSGGCPGLAGTPGGSGGASIAVYVVGSEVTFEDVTSEAGVGGRAGVGTSGSAATGGGAGAAGGAGTVRESVPVPFGPPIPMVYNVTGGVGGAGGRGGAAGVSGHGAPGPSIGMVVFGAKPVVKGGSIKPGEGGQGAPEVGPRLPATDPGMSVDVLVVK